MRDRYSGLDKPSWSLFRCVFMLGPRLGYNYWAGNWEFVENNLSEYSETYRYYRYDEPYITENEEDFLGDLNDVLNEIALIPLVV